MLKSFSRSRGSLALFPTQPPGRTGGDRAGGSRAPACRCLRHGRRCRGMLSALLRRRESQRRSRRKQLPGHGQCLSLREGYRGSGVPGGTAKPPPTGSAGRPRFVRCPWPGCRHGPRESPRIRCGRWSRPRSPAGLSTALTFHVPGDGAEVHLLRAAAGAGGRAAAAAALLQLSFPCLLGGGD